MTNKRLAFLATGDEIVNGDILNTNGQKMAHDLFEQGIEIGMHLVASDCQTEMETAIQFLLQHHDGLIITGGLGPTSDDRTRFALAKAINKELEFDEPSWQFIQDRLASFALKNQPISNKNQAYFPKGSTIIPNANGTAAGCYVEVADKLIFMLPGPPRECLPMFDEVVQNVLKEKNFNRPFFHRKWLLFSVSEGQIAEQLDNIAEDFDVITGYRMSYPYVEFKLHSENEQAIKDFEKAASPLLQKHLINPESRRASEMLIEHLENSEQGISLFDDATKGHLASTITNLKTHAKIFQQDDSEHLIQFKLSGIPEYWEGLQSSTEPSWVEIEVNGSSQRVAVPFRGPRTLMYATEVLANEILKVLKN
jgi:nicotinamide-nucleotide amidase